MMKKLLALALLCLAYAPASFADPVLNDVATTTINRTNGDIQRCGLHFADPRSVGLPFPPNDARYAIMNRSGQLLAYYRENFWGSRTQMYYSNPNGTYPHVIELNDNQVTVNTPSGGTVAAASRVWTPGGYGYNLYCRDRGPVAAWVDLYRCVDANYTNVITYQLCRWANNYPPAPTALGGFGG